MMTPANRVDSTRLALLVVGNLCSEAVEENAYDKNSLKADKHWSAAGRRIKHCPLLYSSCHKLFLQVYRPVFHVPPPPPPSPTYEQGRKLVGDYRLSL
jgi:hypothetical protein